ncbi:MAG: hypothetical protein C0518_11285 [Opitutus sp.]|nr:hypothetical protein [Opitutus sp.]
MNGPSLSCIVVLACTLTSFAFAQGHDPVVGRWFGVADQPGDPAGIGFEIQADAQGALRATATNTTIQFVGRPAGPVTVQGGGVYQVGGITLTLRDETLTGEMTALRIPVRLQRVDAMPAPATMPEFPPGPAPKWKAALGAPLYAAPAVRDGVAYVGSTGGLFHAVNLADGRFKWAFAAGRPIHGEATVTDAAVYFVCDNGYLFKLNRADGTEVWRYDLGDARVPRTLLHFMNLENDHGAPRPLLVDGTLYVGAGDGGFHAVDAASGQRVWRFAAEGKIRQTAEVAGDLVFFGTIGNAQAYAMGLGQLYAVKRSTGELAWQHDMRGAATSAPVLVGDKLIVGNRGSTLLALNPATGAVLWRKYFWGSWVESTPVPAGELFYLGSADLRTVRAYDPRDGSYRWSTYVHGWMWDRVAVSDDTIYAATGCTDLPGKPYHASLFALERATGRVKWRVPMPELPGVLFSGFGSAPVLADGLLLAASLDGTLYAFPTP